MECSFCKRTYKKTRFLKAHIKAKHKSNIIRLKENEEIIIEILKEK